MRYEHVLGYVASQVWAMAPEKLHEILAVLAFRARGGAFTPEEIEARVGARSAGVRGGGAVGVLPIRGTIAHRMGGMDESSGGMSTERLSGMLKALVADPSVGTILLDVDSAGGTVTGVAELADEVYAARETKRVVALVNGMAASAAYWLASQAHEIVSIPSGMSGSIGVYTAHQDLSAMLEQDGVKMTLISAGKHKVEGNPFAPLADETRAHLQGLVDESMQQFVAAVARGRGVSAAEVRSGFGEGRALRGKAAKAAGLVDRIATVDDTLARLVGRGSAVSGAVAAEQDPVIVVAEVAEASSIEADMAADADRARRLRLA